MPSLGEFRIGDILKFNNGEIGIVSHGDGVTSTYRENGKFIFILLEMSTRDDFTRYCGQVAMGYLQNFYAGNFEHIGNINDLL